MGERSVVSLSPNLVNNQLSIAQRWLKLYRTIFNAFLKIDFVHIRDFKLFESQMNARIATLEANLAAAVATTNINISTSILGHTHLAPQAPAGALPTGPGLPVAPLTPVPVPTTPAVNIKDTFAQQQDAIQQATGPALAPLGDGLSPEAQTANITVLSDIGVS